MSEILQNWPSQIVRARNVHANGVTCTQKFVHGIDFSFDPQSFLPLYQVPD